MPAHVSFDVNFLSSIRGLTPVVTEAGGLNVAVDEFSCEVSGVTTSMPAQAVLAVQPNALNFVYVDNAGVVQVSQAGYPADSCRLARVETGPDSVNSIIVDRAAIRVSPVFSDLPLYSPLTTPSSPPVGRARIYARQRHGRPYLDMKSPNGRDFPFQPFFGTNMVTMWMPESGTTIRTIGMPSTNVGTVSHPALAATNLSTSFRRWRLTSATTANSASENRSAQTMVWRGNASGLGGFTLIMRVCLSTLPANHRAFFGLLSATGATSTSQVPSALTNCLGFAYDSAETTFRFQHNDAAGTATRIDLGASFPSNSTTAVYTMFVYSAPNGTNVGYRIVREDTGAVVDSFVTTDIPAATTFLTPHLYMNNGGTAAACSFDCGGVYLESDY